jgi:hypothetical protein
MKDHQKSAGEPDRARVLLDDDRDVRYWTREFRLTVDELRGAIAASGTNSATRLREYLRTSGMI